MSASPDDPQLVEAWREVLECHAKVSCAMERALQQLHGIGLSEYEVLERLATSDKPGCRVQEIAEAVHLSQSALSRLIGRLEADGLAQRSMCEQDRRGIYVHLTDAGRARYEEARPTHRTVLANTMPASAPAAAAGTS